MTNAITLSPQQSAFIEKVKTGTSSIALIAVAGAGKTFTLVKACEHMKGNVFFGVYNAKMGAELKQKTAHLPHVTCKTFHGAGYGRLMYFFRGRPQEQRLKTIDDKKVLTLLDTWIAEKGRKDLEPLAVTIAKIVSMAKQRGIGPIFADADPVWREMIEHFDLIDDLPEEFEGRGEEEILAIVIKLSRIILRSSIDAAKNEGWIDFDDMVFMPLVMNLRMFQNDWVLIDEAQDTNPTRRALARKMLKPGGKLIAVGDPRQAIYGFSGADNDALDQIVRDFNCVEMPLTTTYRCPKSAVRVAREFVDHIEAHETAPEGEVVTVKYEDILEYAKPGDAILCRYNKYLVGLCFRFIRNGIAARIEGRAIGASLVQLVRKWKTVNLDTLAKRVIAWRDREMKKANDKKNDSKALQIEDRAETVLVLIERAKEEGINTINGLCDMITGLFDDNVVDKKDMITLCSQHRSKGLEWKRVFILGLYELGGRVCRQQWQTEQEVNLQYVAATRVMETLYSVVGVKEEGKQQKLEEYA